MVDCRSLFVRPPPPPPQRPPPFQTQLTGGGGYSLHTNPRLPPAFLDACNYCKKRIGPGEDWYMNGFNPKKCRGLEAYFSSACREKFNNMMIAGKRSLETEQSMDHHQWHTKKSLKEILIMIEMIMTLEEGKIDNLLHPPLSPRFNTSSFILDHLPDRCGVLGTTTTGYEPFVVHVAMTLDFEYLRGSIAAVHSILKHSSCPENIYFHFIASESKSPKPDELSRIIKTVFPSLDFKVYSFDDQFVKNLISYSIREALEDPLNYARIYLADILDSSVSRVIYLDSDIIVVDDIQKLWSLSLGPTTAIRAPVYCHANFTKYFTNRFWSDSRLSRVFDGKKPCYFNTRVMVMDLMKWRTEDYRSRIERWMEIQKEERIYDLGSLPPFLLVFGSDVAAIDHMDHSRRERRMK
ncbi:hypothetical protein LXL04_032762 [Taraxacum kok-saghyz]